MSLTRKLLKGMGLTDEQVDTIIEAHSDTVDGLKEQVKIYKADAEKLPSVQKELDDLKAAGDDGWEEKAKDWERKYTDLVAENQSKETRAAKEKAYRDLLKQARVSEKRLDKVLKVSDVDSVELDEKGAIKGADTLLETIKNEWADFIVSENPEGLDIDKPGSNGEGGGKGRGQSIAAQLAAKHHASLYGAASQNNGKE